MIKSQECGFPLSIYTLGSVLSSMIIKLAHKRDHCLTNIMNMNIYLYVPINTNKLDIKHKLPVAQ